MAKIEREESNASGKRILEVLGEENEYHWNCPFF